MHPTEALTTMSFANFLQTTDAVGLFVFGLLVLMSIVTWYFIILKAARVICIRTRSSRVVRLLVTGGETSKSLSCGP